MLNKHEKELVKEYATKLIKKRKLTENTLNPSTVLKQLNKASSTRFESGYHYNKSTGAESNELHYRPSTFIRKIPEYIRNAILNKLTQYHVRFTDTGVYISPK